MSTQWMPKVQHAFGEKGTVYDVINSCGGINVLLKRTSTASWLAMHEVNKENVTSTMYGTWR